MTGGKKIILIAAVILLACRSGPAAAQSKSSAHRTQGARAKPGPAAAQSKSHDHRPKGVAAKPESAAGADQQPLSTSAIVDSLTPEWLYLRQHLDQFTTPAYRERKSALRSFQRRGYSEVLMELCARDGLGGLIEYLRMSLHIEYSMDHAPIFFRTPANELKDLPLDWSMPEDPWSGR